MILQVSLNWKIGPVIAQMRMMATAIIKVMGRPEAREAALAVRVNQERRLPLSFDPILPTFSTERRTQPFGSLSNN